MILEILVSTLVRYYEPKWKLSIVFCLKLNNLILTSLICTLKIFVFGDNSEEICPFNTFFDHHRDNVPLVVTFNSVNFKQIIWTKYYIKICKETDFVKLKRGKTTVVKIALNE